MELVAIVLQSSDQFLAYVVDSNKYMLTDQALAGWTLSTTAGQAIEACEHKMLIHNSI